MDRAQAFRLEPLPWGAWGGDFKLVRRMDALQSASTTAEEVVDDSQHERPSP